MKSRSIHKKLSYPIPTFMLCIVKQKRTNFKPIRITTPKDVLPIIAPLTMAAEEYFIALHLNVKHEVIGVHEVAHGTLTESLVHPREVFKAALLANSFAIMVCHNHPSGSLSAPSREDYITTRQLIKAGNLLGVAVIDHLILASNFSQTVIYSFRDKHPDLWLTKDEPEQD